MKREKFGSRLGFILVSAGCAIGLGNVWKFPYMAGKYGGAAFILIYLFFLALMGLPIIVCEFGVGRASQRSIASSFDRLEPESSHWHRFKWLGVAGNYLLVMFYSMVGGWMLFYCFRLIRGEFDGASSLQIEEGFHSMLSSPGILGFWTIFVICIAFGVCVIGLQKGVEKVTKIMMICLLSLMVLLAIRSITLENAMEGIRFYLVPDFKSMMSYGLGNVIYGAMSQAFFTLSIGMGGMAIFGSYLDKKRSLTGESISIVLLDTFVALTAGLIVIPACFAFNVAPDAGPGLVFITLPNIFVKMAGGRLWGALFFLFLSFAALSTIIGVFENIVSFGVDLWNWSRKKAVAVNIIVITLLCIPCILGFNVLSWIEPLGKGSNIMDLEDFLVSGNIMPLGSIVYLMFCTRENGWGWKSFMKEVNSGEGISFPRKLKFYMRNILPCIVVGIYLKGYYDMFHKESMLTFFLWMCAAVVFLVSILKIVSYQPEDHIEGKQMLHESYRKESYSDYN